MIPAKPQPSDSTNSALASLASACSALVNVALSIGFVTDSVFADVALANVALATLASANLALENVCFSECSTWHLSR